MQNWPKDGHNCQSKAQYRHDYYIEIQKKTYFQLNDMNFMIQRFSTDSIKS